MLGYCAADVPLCFRICKIKAGFLMTWLFSKVLVLFTLTLPTFKSTGAVDVNSGRASIVFSLSMGFL